MNKTQSFNKEFTIWKAMHVDFSKAHSEVFQYINNCCDVLNIKLSKSDRQVFEGILKVGYDGIRREGESRGVLVRIRKSNRPENAVRITF